MPRWFSPADAAACVAAGVGAWFTRGSLDVFAAPAGEARVAMLPAPVELVGLVALACLSAFLLRIILGRSRFGPTSHLLLPLVSVLAIGIPYVPWLPDAVPAWRALAGPARFALWALVCGQIAWIGIDVLRHHVATRGGTRLDLGAAGLARRGSPHWLDQHWRALVILLASFAAGAALAAHATANAFGPMGPLGTGRVSVALRLSLGAVISTSMWLWARRVAGSDAAASTAWLAVAGSAPFLLSGIAGPVALAAAGCVVVATGWPAAANDSRTWAATLRGSALAALAWLDVAYVPLACVLAACLLWRMRHARPAVIAAALPLALMLAAITFGPQRLRPLAPEQQAVFWSAAALLAGQQNGLLIYAPAIALALPGLRLLWREGPHGYIAVIEAVAGTAATLLTAGWQPDAARAPAIPGLALMPALPLLVVPIGCWVRYSAPLVARVALARLLVLWGVIATAALSLAPRGAGARGREGASALLQWLGSSRELIRAAPVATAAGDSPLPFAVSTLIWMAVAAGLWCLIVRTRPTSQGGAAVMVTIGTLAGFAVGAAAVEATLGPRLPAREAPTLRVDARMLDGFDARRRPLAVAYDRWRALPAAAVPPLFAFDATPGARRHPQPLRVLLNTRLSLPAGDYVVSLQPKAGAALAGNAGLQVGRMGPPMREWQIAAAPGEPWTASFTLPVDASFVGLRTTPEFERSVAALRVQPTHVVNGRDRPDLPAVLSSATYKDVMVTFHGEQVYAERNGFWVRGRSTLLATFTRPEGSHREPGVRLSLHGGAAATHVRFETSTWSTTVALERGVSRELLVPALQGQALLPVRITPDSGFVPAEAHGGSDRRLLGCWIEVLE